MALRFAWVPQQVGNNTELPVGDGLKRLIARLDRLGKHLFSRGTGSLELAPAEQEFCFGLERQQPGPPLCFARPRFVGLLQCTCKLGTGQTFQVAQGEQPGRLQQLLDLHPPGRGCLIRQQGQPVVKQA